MQLRLRDYFAKKFNEAKKTDSDVFKSNRAMAKLFKEAGRVKKVLSANTEHVAQVFLIFSIECIKHINFSFHHFFIQQYINYLNQTF